MRSHRRLEALRGVNARAVIVGFGPERWALEQAAEGRVLFTGALEHRHLAQLWPLADVSVTPSVFPEAFGMVAAEAAACGSPPLVARHSGLAEVAAGLAQEYPVARRDLVAFDPDDAGDLAVKLRTLLALPPDEREELGRAARGGRLFACGAGRGSRPACWRPERPLLAELDDAGHRGRLDQPAVRPAAQ